MVATGKPSPEPGMICPLMKQDISECCSKCMFWGSIKANIVDGKTTRTVDHWDCSINMIAFISGDIVREINGLQSKQAEFNDKAYGESQQTLESVIELAKGFEKKVFPALEKMGRETIKQIEGN